MNILVMIALTISAPQTETELGRGCDLKIIRSNDLWEAPRLSPLPDLPEPQLSPEQGYWTEDTGKRWPAGVFLPPLLNLHLRCSLRALDKMPELFQVQLDQLRLFHDAKVQAELEKQAAKNTAENIRGQVPGGYSLSTVVMWTGIGLGAGALTVALGFLFAGK